MSRCKNISRDKKGRRERKEGHEKRWSSLSLHDARQRSLLTGGEKTKQIYSRLEKFGSVCG